jgi:hypothetical protein
VSKFTTCRRRRRTRCWSRRNCWRGIGRDSKHYARLCSVELGAVCEEYPHPRRPPAERRAIERLVRRLLALRGEGEEAAALEQELNERVYRLFGLKEEIALIEESLGRTTAR